MMWSRFIASVDWATINDADTDLIIEMLMSLSFRKRLRLFQEWEPLDANKRPKGADEIIDELAKKYPETMQGNKK